MIEKSRHRMLLASVFVSFQIWLFSLGNVGDGGFGFPIPIVPIIFTITYALVTKTYAWSFIVGLLSMFSFFFGVALYYYISSRSIVLPPLNEVFLVFMGLAVSIGGLGLLVVRASRALIRSQNGT